jgi:hypothetical protein
MAAHCDTPRGRSAGSCPGVFASQRLPYDPDSLFGLAVFHRDRGELAQALGYAERLAAVSSDDPQAREPLAELRRPRREREIFGTFTVRAGVPLRL